MESTRDVRRLIEKEIKKGSAPLAFEKICYPPDALKEIASEEKLGGVLSYLFRTGEYESLANKMTRNNVYMENHLMWGNDFGRRNHVIERNANYKNIIAYAKRLKPQYEGKTFVESVPCYFTFPKEELPKYRFIYEGAETYAFPLSGKHIINGLYLMAVMHRKELALSTEPDFEGMPGQTQIYKLEKIRAVLFQCLLLDDMHLKDGAFVAQLYTVYLLQ